MPEFVGWPDILDFAHVRANVSKYAHFGAMAAEGVTYRAKTKLHGVNAAVRVNTDGTHHAQSRAGIITPDDDNDGFAAFVETLTLEYAILHDYVLFGEWHGLGVRVKGDVSARRVPKSFSVFAVYLPGLDHLIVEPNDISGFLPANPAVRVIDWHTSDAQHVDFEAPDAFVSSVNERTADACSRDSWIAGTFGLTGKGEGLIYYPIEIPASTAPRTLETFRVFVFKAKGEEHRVKAAPAPAESEIAAPATIDAFCDMFVTPARLEQGVSATCLTGTAAMQYIADFIRWFAADVEKESKEELELSGLSWKAVVGEVARRARTWYLEQARRPEVP